MSKPTVFISYSHRDEKWLKELQTHLEPFVRNLRIDPWDDTRIQAGDKWRKEISSALKSAAAAILLVTPHFVASKFIAEEELPPLLEANHERGLTIYWLAIRPSAFEQAGLDAYQCVNNRLDGILVELSFAFKASCPSSKRTSPWNNPASTTPKATWTGPANPSPKPEP